MEHTASQFRRRQFVDDLGKSRAVPLPTPPVPKRQDQHPLPPAKLRSQIIEEYQARHDGETPDRDYVLKEIYKRVGVNSVAEPRLKQSGGVPPKR
jgi:hypothetical protein